MFLRIYELWPLECAWQMSWSWTLVSVVCGHQPHLVRSANDIKQRPHPQLMMPDTQILPAHKENISGFVLQEVWSVATPGSPHLSLAWDACSTSAFVRYYCIDIFQPFVIKQSKLSQTCYVYIHILLRAIPKLQLMTNNKKRKCRPKKWSGKEISSRWLVWISIQEDLTNCWTKNTVDEHKLVAEMFSW